MHLLPLLMIAAAFWGQTPACGEPTISPAQLQAVYGDLEVLGMADRAHCAIVVDPSRFRAAGWACEVILHEYGHLLGYGHSTDPEDVMYPIISRPVWPCRW